MEQKYLFVVFSSTPYKLGRFIRRVTGAQYNHVSISLEPDLSRMYGFARRYYHTPFYGGFVLETPSRYLLDGVSAQIKLCRIPISDSDHRLLSKFLEDMYIHRELYLYNHFSAWAFPLHCRIPVKKAYVCVEFCVNILHRAGIKVDPAQYYSISDIELLLKDYVFYIGPMFQNGVTDEAFYAEKPLRHPIYTSLRSIAALIPRLGRE